MGFLSAFFVFNSSVEAVTLFSRTSTPLFIVANFYTIIYPKMGSTLGVLCQENFGSKMRLAWMMFASARTAATAPLSSPSLKRIFEFAQTHPNLVGLGIRTSPSSPSTMAMACTLGSSGSSQSAMHRSSLARMQSPNNSPRTPPRAPRPPCAAVFPSVYSPLFHTPLSVQSLLDEGYFSNDETSTEIRKQSGVRDSGSEIMNMHSTDRRRRRAATMSSLSSTFRASLYDAYPSTSEVERIGLGISGLSLSTCRRSSGTITLGSSDDDDDDDDDEDNTLVPDAMEAGHSRLMIKSPSTKRMGFNVRAEVIQSPTDDGYAADGEHEDRLLVPSRYIAYYHVRAVSVKESKNK
ncbi:uncharacterized protein FOMMEDRAFT_24854 [Fomitiporia mediterranea MF3/22]|uniref:uncharacterized protein n=1 Tax=Fomitiporia mediterranea (strain MF3/22) TaxID=694068 RepID=UPI0004409C78|nr:uncharacterized protein FOMMEDRAFT_24854 [Fomitiporia mediterranea MF3/22]EJD07487.1 hypothetical protein FOMMEDRAFT_24854 [Fomitiporia mediterranea MF3/22]